MYNKIKIAASLLILIIFGAVQYSGAFPALDNAVYDNFICGERQAAPNIIIVGMDERSMMEIGRWPWPRFYIADTIEKLTEYGAAAIGVNVWYDNLSDNEEYDNALVSAAEKTDRLVLAATGVLAESAYQITAEDYIGPFEELEKAARTGFINVLPDRDGVMRRSLTSFKYGDITKYSLPYEVYRTYTGEDFIDIPLDSSGSFPINYAAKPGGFTVLSLWGVINDEYNPGMLKDAIVLVGPYAEGIGTGNFPTPLDRRAPTYAVEINANILQTMLEGVYKREAPWQLNSVFLAVLGLSAAFLFYKLKPLPAACSAAALTAVSLIGTKLLYLRFDVIVKSGDCIVFLIVCYALNLALGILSAQSEKQHIQGLFGRYVAPEVVNEILSGGAKIELGGTERFITVLFVDIRGFTAFSEANPPQKVVSMVNRYLELTSRSIQENGGTIDKYVGDATMAVFNAPNELADHAMLAVKAGWAMKQGSIALRDEILRDYGVDLQFGVGINTGSAIVGNMGSAIRMDYTAIGDTVNTAARLESNAEKGQIILSDATYQLVKDKVEVVDLGILNVKNKKVGIQIYNLEGIK